MKKMFCFTASASVASLAFSEKLQVTKLFHGTAEPAHKATKQSESLTFMHPGEAAKRVYQLHGDVMRVCECRKIRINDR